MKKGIANKLKFLKTLGKILLPLIILLFPFLLIAFTVSPKFFAWVLRLFFNRQFTVPPKEFLYTDTVQSITDVKYGLGNEELFDLHLPAGRKGPFPLIIWAHGGAYVAGYRGYLTFFARILAHYGYAVASIDYELAPEAHYPSPLVQIGKAYTFLTTNEYQGKNFVDINKVFLAGDSAGAQLVAQFALLQTNLNYRKSFMHAHPDSPLPEVIPSSILKGLLLYCGPISFSEFQKTPKILLKFLFWQMTWAYFGKRRTSKLTIWNEIDVIPHLTADFPPSFITDGNTLTFPQHVQAFSDALKELKVPTSTLIFDDPKNKVYHEFELDLATPEAQKALLMALAFLKKYRD